VIRLAVAVMRAHGVRIARSAAQQLFELQNGRLNRPGGGRCRHVESKCTSPEYQASGFGRRPPGFVPRITGPQPKARTLEPSPPDGVLFEVGERTLHAMEKRHLEIDAAAQIAQQIRHRRAAGLVEHPAHGPRARRIRELCLRAVET